MLHVLYLVHDLSDPAVRRRVAMLRAGGAEVTLAGFRRAAGPAAGLEAPAPIELGRTADGRFAQRLAAVARAAMTLGVRLGGVRRPDVIIGRNLEMLALAGPTLTIERRAPVSFAMASRYRRHFGGRSAHFRAAVVSFRQPGNSS